MKFTITQTSETILDIEIVKQDDKYIAKVKRDYFLTDEDEYECWIEDGEQLMCEPASSDEEYDAIIETFKAFILANSKNKYARKCTKCGCGMNEGFVINDGEEYYCGDDCLHKVYTPKEWEEMSSDEENKNSMANYWTEWHDVDDDDEQFVLFNNQLINI